MGHVSQSYNHSSHQYFLSFQSKKKESLQICRTTISLKEYLPCSKCNHVNQPNSHHLPQKRKKEKYNYTTKPSCLAEYVYKNIISTNNERILLSFHINTKTSHYPEYTNAHHHELINKKSPHVSLWLRGGRATFLPCTLRDMRSLIDHEMTSRQVDRQVEVVPTASIPN